MVSWSRTCSCALMSLEAARRRSFGVAVQAFSRRVPAQPLSPAREALDRAMSVAIAKEVLDATHVDRRDVEAVAMQHDDSEPSAAERRLAALERLAADVEMQWHVLTLVEGMRLHGMDPAQIPNWQDDPRAIVAAELAMLAREERAPHLALAGPAHRTLLEPEGPGEWKYGRSIHKVLVELDLVSPDAVFRLDEHLALLRKLFETPPARLREAAARAYVKETGLPSLPLVRTPIP